MSAISDRISDTLEPIGIVVGAFLILAALGTVVGMPWQTNGNTVVTLLQFVGIASMIAIGGGLIWLARQPA